MEPFSTNPTRREELVQKFLLVLDTLKNMGVKFELWLDGSFSTQKVEPEDIDILCIAETKDLNSLDINKQNELRNLLNKSVTKARYGCEIYFVDNSNINMKSYWRGWFGFSRDDKPKGIPRLIVN